MKPEDFDYVTKNNLCLFQKGPFSQWYGGWSGQNGGFKYDKSDLLKKYKIVCDVGEELSFNCCEQWMMANKALLFRDVYTFERIMEELSPKKQKALGREVVNYNQKMWDLYKYQIVLKGNLIKFYDNPDVQEFLLSFNVHTIFVEAAPWDKIWGIGLAPDDPRALDIYKWEGENLLGMAIGATRKKLHRKDLE